MKKNVFSNDAVFWFFLVDEANSLQSVPVSGGRMVPADLLDSGDLECSLCMRSLHAHTHAYSN